MARTLLLAITTMSAVACATKQVSSLDPIAYEARENALFNALDMGRSARRACHDAPVPKPVCGELDGRWKRVIDYQFHYHRAHDAQVVGKLRRLEGRAMKKLDDKLAASKLNYEEAVLALEEPAREVLGSPLVAGFDD